MNWLYDDQLSPRPNGNKAEIAILDFGFNTLDWPSLKRFTAVIPTGAGALVLSDKLKMALAAKGAVAPWPR